MPLFSKSEKQGLWPLCPKDPDEEDCVDIFAIHGLGGEKFRTWTDSGKLWLRDLLPEQLPEARIFTYGYDSTVAFSKSSAEVDDFARDLLHRVNSVRKTKAEQTRPMVFICHSLGGLLFKQALVICHNDERYRHLIKKFHGVIFMGTPHGGSDIAFWASYAGNLINAISLGTRTNKDLLRVLRRDSPFLGSLSQKFVLHSRSMHILSFYETEKFPMLNCRIVEKESAYLNISNELFLPIQADHRTMCHFSDPTSQKYISASSAIVGIVRANTIVTPSLDPSFSPHRVELNKWLDPLPMVDDYDRKQSLRLEHTCEWINQESKFISWRNNTRRNVELWVRGPPGCGKSTLATSIIHQLAMEGPTAYFFCNLEDPDRSNFTTILRTLTWQLVLVKPHLAYRVYDIYLETAGATTPVDSYKRALTILLEEGEPCYVVIDGLDECRGKYMDIQRALYHVSTYAKLLVISRWEIWIKQCFPLGQMTPILDISTTHTSEDLKRFVDNKSRELDLDPALTVKLAQLLIAKAEGMFLWVKLTIEYLSQQPTLEDTLAALEDLPDGLELLYERLVRQLQALPPRRYNLARKLLQWTFSSRRPLSLEELKSALSITPGDARKKNPTNVLNLEKFVRESCGSLLELDEATGNVHFVHASAVDFLSRAARDGSGCMQSDDPLFVAKVPNSYCASVCLTYLATENVEFVPDDRDLQVYTKNLEGHLKRYPFLHYCALNWWKHLPMPLSQPDRDQETLKRSIRLLTSNQHCIVLWVQLFQLLDGAHEDDGPQATLFRSPDSPYSWGFADRRSLFYNLWAAPSGLFTRWQRWRTEIFFNGKFSQPIGIASFFDFIQVVKSECEKGKEINASDAIGLTPAMLATHGESPQVLQYLIDNGADMKLTSNFGYGIARYASRNCPSILRKVLDWGASASVSTLADGGTAIHAACTSAGFHPKIISELLKNTCSADLDAKDFSGRTALHYAVAINIQSYARLVFDRGSIVAGALPQHRRLHTGSPEEAFMPSTRTEIKTWWHLWTNYFGNEPEGIDSEELYSETSEFEEDSIADLVRKIKATMIIRLVEGGASITETDDQGRNALDIVLDTGFAENLEDIDNNGLCKVSQALVALGAKETASNRPRALDVALMRGHRITVKGILHGDAAPTELSGSDQRFLSTFVNQNTSTTKSSKRTEKCYQPQSPLAALHTSFILRFCLKKYSRSSTYDESIFNKLSTLIVDFAEYWVETGDSVNGSEERHGTSGFRSLRNQVGAYVIMAEGELRKIEIYVIDSASERHISEILGSYAGTYGRHYYSSLMEHYRGGPEGLSGESSRRLPDAPILKMLRRPEDSTEGSLHDWMKQALGQRETVMVPSDKFQPRKYGSRCEQTRYLPSSVQMGGVTAGCEEITKWLISVSSRDTIILLPTQDFFAHDVALYEGFGFKIYCAWI